MTFKEYYLEHQNTGGFFTIDEFTTAYPSIDRASNAQLMTILGSKIVALAGQLTYEPVWSYPYGISYELEKVGFLKQYPLEKLYEVVKAGFGESETENSDNTKQVVFDGSNTGSTSTFKSFPQVTSTELINNNKVGETSENDTSTSTTDETGYNNREVIRTYNTAEQTEKLASFMADTLTRMAKDYIKLTAVDGVYTAPADLDD